MATLTEIEGIGPKYAKMLQDAGVRSTDALLQQGATPQGRKAIAEKARIDPNLILEWVNHVDLFRIKGVASEYSDLLEEGGVDTVVELAQRNAENLHQKLVQVNESKALVRQLPTQAQVKDWVEQAKKLRRIITY